MRVLHVISALPQAAGTSVFCAEVCEHLQVQGVECCIVVQKKKADDYVLGPAVSVIEMGSVFSGLPIVPDLVHIHALWDPFLHKLSRWACLKNIPLVYSPHGMLAPWALKHKWLKKKIAWWLYQKRDLQGAALFHVTAESEIKWLRDLGFKQPCVLAPLGSDLPDIDPAKAQRRKEVKTMLFVGRIYPVKGLLNLVRAWALVRSSKVLKCESAERSSLVHYCDSSLVGKPEDGERSSKVRECESAKVGGDVTENGATAENAGTLELQNFRTSPWQLVIAGPDQAGHKAEVVAEAKRLGLRVEDATTNELMNSRTNELLPDLIFTGPVYGADKDALHRIADLFVLPSFTENFGVVVTDALSYGIPVITTKGTPWSELLGNEESVSGKQLTVSGKPLSNAQHGRGQPFTVNHSRFTDYTANGRCGWWIDIGVEPLAVALKEAMSLTDEEREAMGQGGRGLVKQKYTWTAVAERIMQAYERCLNTKDGVPMASMSLRRDNGKRQ